MGTLDPPERSDSFQPGQSFGKFYLVQVLGEGGTSRIFKALQQPISRLVALKIPSFAATQGILTPDEFLSEATLMARLDHPNIVRIHDFGVEEGRAFISMEYVEGWNLLDLVERRHPLPAAAVLAIGLQVLEALLHAHARDVLHQDLSPANVLVSRSGVAKLVDFGMAGRSTAARGGSVVGTPAVLSPEHVAGEPCTARSDLFSFGSLLYYLCRGEPLFDPGEGNSRLAEAFREIERARWQPPLERLRGLPASLSQLVRAALEGGDASAVLRDMRELWAQSEGQTPPEEALRRELQDGDAGSGARDPASGTGVRERYLLLRSEGRHREAVALLERGLRRFPDDPLLRELLATPPVRAKSAPVTMEVGAPAPSAGAPAEPAPPRGRSARRLANAAATRITKAGVAGFLLALGVAGALALRRAPETPIPSGPRAAEASSPSPEAPIQGNASATSAAAAAAPSQDAPAAGNTPATSPFPVAARPHAASPAPAPPPPRPAAAPASGLLTRVSATSPGRGAPSLPGAAPAAGRQRPAAPRGAALIVSGPPETRVTVNDTLELRSPAPRGGWALPAGLVNLVVTHPGLDQPISSSLFAAADTLYVLHVERDGAFSVSRRRR